MLSIDKNCNKPKNVVICGGGIIGCSIAFQLAKRLHSNEDRSIRQTEITIIEKCDIACAASGKAGGFLARNWLNHSPLQQLARKSFEMYEKDFHSKEITDLIGMPEEQGQRQPLETFQAKIDASGQESSRENTSISSISSQSGIEIRKQIDKESAQIQDLSSMDDNSFDTAQVHPKLFTKALQKAATKLGVKTRFATVTNILTSQLENGKKQILGVKIKSQSEISNLEPQIEENIEADVVVISMGPWSNVVSSQFYDSGRLPKIYGKLSPSLIIKPGQNFSKLIGAHTLFCDLKLRCEDKFSNEIEGNIRHLSPEIYTRPDGTVYLCGVGSSYPSIEPTTDLIEDPLQIHAPQERIELLKHIASQLSTGLDVLSTQSSKSDSNEAATVIAEQGCYRPLTSDCLPLISDLPNYEGAFMATGHNCQGILLAPATGLAIAEQIVDGQSHSIDLRPFSVLRTGRGSI